MYTYTHICANTYACVPIRIHMCPYVTIYVPICKHMDHYVPIRTHHLQQNTCNSSPATVHLQLASRHTNIDHYVLILTIHTNMDHYVPIHTSIDHYATIRTHSSS